MRIDIQKIKAKNFFSIGNGGIEFDYRTGLYRVTGNNKDSNGRNGAGKSVVLCETLAFGFYGKPIRKITKDEMLNSVNNKACEVEIYFNKEGSNYVIKRGIKPNFLIIEKDGEVQGVNANMKTTQKEIERILGSDFQTFTHLLVMSNSYSTPFMDLDSSKKRSIIEDVLGISVLGKMSDIIKRDYVELRNNIKLQEKESEFLLKSYNELKEYHDELKLKSTKFEEVKKEKIDSLNENKDKLKINIEKINKVYIDEENINISISLIKEKKTKYMSDNKVLLSELSLNKKQLDKLNKKINDIKDNPICPICNTKTDSEHVKKHIVELNEQVDNCNSLSLTNKSKINSNKSKIEKIDNKVDELNIKLKRMKDLSKKKKSIEEKLTLVEHKLTSILNEENTLNELIDLDKEENKLKDYNDNKDLLDNFSNKFKKLGFMKQVLSDDGIKNYIIRKVIKFWNMKVNKYLSEMNVNFNIIFDENLDSKLKSRGRDLFSYHNFSGGERSRIDVAILLSMLDLSRLQNNIDLNLMVIDELFDSAIDTNGREEILNLFKNKSIKENKSIYVISHSSDLPIDLFDKEITIHKKDGFTTI